jgi:mevalonate pyrophosphate decarboxylase
MSEDETMPEEKGRVGERRADCWVPSVYRVGLLVGESASGQAGTTRASTRDTQRQNRSTGLRIGSGSCPCFSSSGNLQQYPCWNGVGDQDYSHPFDGG